MYNEHIDKITERTDFTTDSNLKLLKMQCANFTNPWTKMWMRNYIENVYNKQEYLEQQCSYRLQNIPEELKEEFEEREQYQIQFHNDLRSREEELLTKYESELNENV